MSFVRASKFRHVFGEKKKKEQCYDGIRITKVTWESTYCAVNSKFLAVMTDAAGGGAFLVLPLSKYGRVPAEQPLVAGHKAAVLALAWCPHNDNVIASCGEDCTVKVWEIPDDGIPAPNMEIPIVSLEHHQKRVTSVVWHPTAKNVLLSSGSDNMICLWDVGQEELLWEFNVPDQIYCISFNYNGSKFVTTCKDKKLRVMDSRSGEILAEQDGHKGTKCAQCVFLKDGRIFTTGFSRMAERQYGLWDSKLENICTEEIDNSNGINFIFYDPDTSVIYLVGKGDCQIRYYEVNDVKPYVHWLANHAATTPQRGAGFMPKRGVNVNEHEIARFFKLHNTGFCEVIPFKVPRKSELFQDDLYPDTASDEPAMDVDDFKAGKFADPLLCSLKGGYQSTKKEQMKVVRKSNILDNKTPAKSQAQQSQSNNAEAAAATPSLPPGFDPQGILDDMRKLKLIVKAHERRIKTLEEKISQYESDEEEVHEA